MCCHDDSERKPVLVGDPACRWIREGSWASALRCDASSLKREPAGCTRGLSSFYMVGSPESLTVALLPASPMSQPPDPDEINPELALFQAFPSRATTPLPSPAILKPVGFLI